MFSLNNSVQQKSVSSNLPVHHLLLLEYLSLFAEAQYAGIVFYLYAFLKILSYSFGYFIKITLCLTQTHLYPYAKKQSDRKLLMGGAKVE